MQEILTTIATATLVAITTGFASLILIETKDDELKLAVVGINIMAIIVGFAAVAIQ